jgi:hypothetical protein
LNPRVMRMGSGEGFTMRNLIVLYRSPNVVRMINSRRLRWAGHVARMEEGRSVFKILTGVPLGRARPRWEDNIRKDFKDVDIDTRNWVDSAQGRNYWITLVNMALHLRIP